MNELIALDLAGGDIFVEALRSIWDNGDAVLPLDQRSTTRARFDLAEAMGASAIWGANDERTTLSDPVEVLAGDAAVITTSGTTGTPKGVVLTHDALAHNAAATSESLGSDRNSWWLACLPLNHVGGFTVVTRALLTGARLTVVDGFDPLQVERLAQSGCTHTSLVPTALGRIDPSSFERILVGGSAAPDDLPANCVTTYGMTETCGGFVHSRRALRGSRIEFDLLGGGRGEIFCSTPALLRSYRMTSETTHRVEHRDPTHTDAEGTRWYQTGDIGSMDESGLNVVGRGDDMMITGGENVWPEPVEEVLNRHPDIAASAVVGVPDPEWGQRVTAVVVTHGNAPSLEALRSFVKEALPAFAAPKDVVEVESLPYTSTGKLQRQAVRQLLERPAGT